METIQPGVTGRRSPATRSKKRLLGIRALMQRYDDCSDRTIDRWTSDPKYADLGFPQPIYIKRRRFWDEDELDDFDARQAARTR
jgi:predicted DNA-binding transcriptional regulator AlpA